MFVSLSCSSADHPPVADDGPLHPPVPSGIGGSDSGGAPSAEAGTTSVAPVEPGKLDPHQVYVYGTLDESTPGRDVVFHFTTPNQYWVGFDREVQGSSVTFDGATLLYLIGAKSEVHRFSPEGLLSDKAADVQYPQDPTADDPLVETPACTGKVGQIADFLVNTEGRMIYHCNDTDPPAWYEGSEVVYAGDALLMALGPGDLALAKAKDSLQFYTLQLSDPANLQAIPGVSRLIASRTYGNGFRVADATGAGTDLVEIGPEGSTMKIGTYPDVPPGLRGPQLEYATRSSALAADNSLIQFTIRQESEDLDVLLLRTLEGKREVVYDEADGPVGRGTGANLFTGP